MEVFTNFFLNVRGGPKGFTVGGVGVFNRVNYVFMGIPDCVYISALIYGIRYWVGGCFACVVITGGGREESQILFLRDCLECFYESLCAFFAVGGT